jgi:hypothetical protein
VKPRNPCESRGFGASVVVVSQHLSALDGVGVYGVAVSAQDTALSNLCQHGL